MYLHFAFNASALLTKWHYLTCNGVLLDCGIYSIDPPPSLWQYAADLWMWILFFPQRWIPLDDVLLLLDGMPQRLSQRHLREVLQHGVDGVSDGVIEHTLHPAHQHLQTLDHRHHLCNRVKHMNTAAVSCYTCTQPHGENILSIGFMIFANNRVSLQ